MLNPFLALFFIFYTCSFIFFFIATFHLIYNNEESK